MNFGLLLDENGHFSCRATKRTIMQDYHSLLRIRQAVRFDVKLMAKSARALYPPNDDLPRSRDRHAAPPRRRPCRPGRPPPAPPSDADAAFRAGAALGALDTLARAGAGGPAPGGSGWRLRPPQQRLAGRVEDEAALRDAWHLRPAGPIPAPPAHFGAWRQLAGSRPAPILTGSKRSSTARVHWDAQHSPDLRRTSINWRSSRRLRSPPRRSPLTSSPWPPIRRFLVRGSPTWCWRKAWAGRSPCRC